MPFPSLSRKSHGVVVFAATIALVMLTGASASVPASAQQTQPGVLQLVGSGQNVWMVVQNGSQVALWSTQSFGGPWKRLGWPSGMDPVQLVRERADAWAVSMDNQLYDTTNAGATWKSVSLPRRLTVHPHWAQGLRIAPIGSHRLALLAWGGEATFQSAKLLWTSSNNGESWTLTAHSEAGPVGATAPWWPRKTKPTLSPYGDPVALHMVDRHIGYLMATTVGGSFLWGTTNGGRAWKRVSVRGISPSIESQGITVLGAQWYGNTGWIRTICSTGPELIGVTVHSARVITPASRLMIGNGIAANLMSVSTGMVIGKVSSAVSFPSYWNLFTTRNGGRVWHDVSLEGGTLPAHAMVTQMYSNGRTIWVLLLSGRLYRRPLDHAAAWELVQIPR